MKFRQVQACKEAVHVLPPTGLPVAKDKMKCWSTPLTELSEVCNHSLLSCRQSKSKNWFSLTSRSELHGSSVTDPLIEYGNIILDYNFLHKHAINKTTFRCKKHLHMPTRIFLLGHSISFTLWQIISYLTHRSNTSIHSPLSWLPG